MADSFGEQYETPVIIVMSLAILLSIIGVVTLNRAFHPHCRASDYTYCSNGHDEHQVSDH